MTYVDGFVLPVPAKNKEKYREIASKAGKIWKEHGALSYMECAAEDTTENDYSLTFGKGIQTQPDETVIFAFITFKDRAHRDAVNKAVMEDPRINEMCSPDDMPFDCSKMLYGGFETIVEY